MNVPRSAAEGQLTFAPMPANANSLIRVSIIMLVCNRAPLIGRALKSILKQDYQHWEVIIVQQGEDPEVNGVVTNWTSRDARIRHLRRGNSEGLARAYNLGVENARGEYIAILDDDDYWLAQHKLRSQVEFLDNHRDYVACGGGMAVTDERGAELMWYWKPKTDADIRKFALIANPIAHSTILFRRRVGETATLYRDTLPGLPDWDLWLTLGQRGKLYNFAELFSGYTLWPRSVTFRRQRDNAKAALEIVWHHRHSYRHVAPAIGLAIVHYVYACLPVFITRRSFFFFSCLKKSLFAAYSERKRRILSSIDSI